MKKNYGGVKAVESEVYKNRLEGIKSEHSAKDPWWATSTANLILVPIFSIMDGMVLFSIFDACLTQSAAMGIVMAFGVAVVLNVLPLLIAKFVHQTMYKMNKQALTALLVCITGFVLIFGGTVLLRFAYSDMYETENNSIQLENTVTNETETEETTDEDSKKKSMAVVVLLSISPLVTSIIGFGIAFISDDEVRKCFEYYEKRDIELDEAISDIEAAIETMNADVERDLNLDENFMNAAIEEIVARENVLKALARQYLAEYLADPKATSKISAEMRVENS